jgi:hypothetical protein
MNVNCPNCELVNRQSANHCAGCGFFLVENVILPENESFFHSRLFKRFTVLIAVCAFALFGFYFSLIVSASKLNYVEKQSVERSIALLKNRGFSGEVFLLEYLTAFRSNDNWLNASIEKESAYAATNFPFEIMTLYPDFFEIPIDDTERAAILLHEAKHLEGAEEKEAYEYVWTRRKQLGWTKELYANSVIWQNVRKQTREFAPDLFVCESNDYADCTEL